MARAAWDISKWETTERERTESAVTTAPSKLGLEAKADASDEDDKELLDAAAGKTVTAPPLQAWGWRRHTKRSPELGEEPAARREARRRTGRGSGVDGGGGGAAGLGPTWVVPACLCLVWGLFG